MRPVGGALLGAYADRHGRKKGLTLTIGLMAGASILIGVIPTYAAIGVLAPILLLLARLVQGFSAGGEFGSSSSFLVESASPGRRAFAGSWQQVSVGAGVLIASGTAYTLTSLLSDALPWRPGGGAWRSSSAACSGWWASSCGWPSRRPTASPAPQTRAGPDGRTR